MHDIFEVVFTAHYLDHKTQMDTHRHVHERMFIMFFYVIRHAWSSSCAVQTIHHLFEDLRLLILKECQAKIILHVSVCSWTCECMQIADPSSSWNVKIGLIF